MRSLVILFIPFLLVCCNDSTDNLEAVCDKSNQTAEVYLNTLDCSQDDDMSPCGMESNKANVRIMNLSAHRICNLILEGMNVGSLEPGETSCYFAYDSFSADRFKYQYTINGDTTFFQQIDSAGIGSDSGNWLYQVSLNYFNRDILFFSGRLVNEDEEEIQDLNPSRLCEPAATSECNHDPNKINIRIQNNSAFSICDFRYSISEEEDLFYGEIGSQELTPYISVDSADTNPFKFEADFGEITIRELDLLWLTQPKVPLLAGDYTFHVAVTNLSDLDMYGRMVEE